jgi:MtN3 and saliva related transmembrane protein
MTCRIIGVASPAPNEGILVSIETVLAVVASSFGVVMGLAPSLQIRRMFRERSSRDVSIGYFAIIAFGSVLWGSYGVSISNLAIVIPNVVGFLASVATILVAHRLRRREPVNASEHSEHELDGERQAVGVAAGLGAGDGPVPLPDTQTIWQSAK